MALTRIEKALSLQGIKVPVYFEHNQATGKPSEPVLSLDTEDTQRFQLWKVNRENGVLAGNELKNISPDLTIAIQNYEDYLESSTYKNWAVIDIANREMQWRFMMVDVGEAVNAKVTIPPSQSPIGSGSNAIGPEDVGQFGGEVSPFLPEYVSTGDPNAPDLVFGDDGDIVTVQ